MADGLEGSAGGDAKPSGPRQLRIFGVDASAWGQGAQFGILAVGALVCAMTFAAMQEQVYHVPDFHYGGFMTLMTSLTYVLCAGVERRAAGDTVRQGGLRDYVLLSVFTMAGMYFTNWSLEYINYPMRIMFKSSKVIPVMLVSVVLLRRRYSRAEYATAALLAAGIALFTMGDAAAAPNFDPRGIVLICVGVFADAVTANFEEQRFFRARNCSHAEVMFYASAFGSLSSLVVLLGTGELWAALAHASANPSVLAYMGVSAAMGYASVVFVLLLIKHFGATVAEVVKSTRKVFSICLSFFLFAKAITGMHVLGFLMFAASVAMGVHLKVQSTKAKAAKEAAARQQAQADAAAAASLASPGHADGDVTPAALV